MSKVQPQRPSARLQYGDSGASSDVTTPGWHDASFANEHATQQNADISLTLPVNQTPGFAIFRTSTTAPSPPMTQFQDSSTLSVDTSAALGPDSPSPTRSSPLSAGLRIQTDITPSSTKQAEGENNRKRSSSNRSLSSKTMSVPLGRTPSIKNVLASSVGSSNMGSAPSSAFSSPMLNAMADVTPLPSPLLSGDSPGPWKKLRSRPQSRESLPVSADAALVTSSGESISSAIANLSKRRVFQGIGLAAAVPNESGLIDPQVQKEKNLEVLHVRNRSLSEYIPDLLSVPKLGHITVSGSQVLILDPTPDSSISPDTHLHREPNLAVQRGLAPLPVAKPPTPPSSRTGGESSDSDSSLSTPNLPRAYKKPRYEYFDAYTRHDSKRRRWRALKVLGQGTFSKVILATSQLPSASDRIDEKDVFGQMEGLPTPTEQKFDRKKLVAIKICEHGPKGGASEERIEMSLKRELEIMKSIHHPSLVHLKAWNIEQSRAILVLSHCPGGDLFEVASEHRELLVPQLLRRIFAELIGAVRYLHERRIVHRDIKLENVLVNLPLSELSSKPPTFDWASYPYSISTLTDLGLSRRVADDEKLTTRCGSDDYAAPEVIMGQPYDGRATDAWSLGVLLYALLESRLPFDPAPPGLDGQAHKQRSRTSHRIARVEWRWIVYAGEDGDHEGDEAKFQGQGLLGAMRVVEGLLKRARSRWTLEKVMQEEWVADGISIEGELRFREEDEADEVDALDGF